MSPDQITFYVRHRDQISEWAALKERVDRSIRDAVTQGSHDMAIKILAAESGDAGVDFYVRNRALITEWDALRTSAGAALHEALLSAAAATGRSADQGKRGWTSARLETPELVDLRIEQKAWIEMVWVKQDLLSTRRGHPFPRIAVALDPSRWAGEDRTAVITATRIMALELDMRKGGDSWWAHWGELDSILESEDLPSYAERCFQRLREVSERMYPPLFEATRTAVT